MNYNWNLEPFTAEETFPRDNILSGAKARARSGVPIGTQGNSFRRGS